MTTRGSIVVTDQGVVVTCHHEAGATTAVYGTPSLENLQDAAHVLAAWLELPSENPAVEAGRIHRAETIKMAIKDAVLGMRDGR